MKVQNIFLATGLALAFAGPASAQSNDVAYCQALVSTYQTYLGHNSGRHGALDANADARVAIDKCNAGDTSGVPVLEQALKNARINLPSRG